ncbi:MAG: lysyl oxidase family protein [Actinomycetota bacterium]
MRRRILLAGVMLVVVSVLAPALAQEPRTVGKLSAGDAVFWTGEPIEEEPEGLLPSLPPLLPKSDECDPDQCFVYRLDVAQKARRLRVAIDTPDCDDVYQVSLYDPQGARRAAAQACYSTELFERSPAVGTWTIRVVPSDVGEDSIFRMRAKLEGKKTEPKRPRRLAPNIRVEPPFDFTFEYGGGITSSSCAEDEIIENGANRCLRFAVGPQNTGRGPLEVSFSPLRDASREPTMYQRLHYSDGRVVTREAGSYEYHKTHRHYHFTGFAKMELFKVIDRKSGEMVRAGGGHKAGFCLLDFKISQWRRFYQARADSARSDCGSPTDAAMGLSTGWTDIYESGLPGNYVDFANNKDGYYVVRVEMDSADKIVETSERDNVAYAFIEVTGTDIRLIERGHGRSPWDPNKTVVVDWWRKLVRG